MKVSRSSKRRAAARTDQVMRQVHETSKNYRWWLFQDEEPAEGYIDEHYSYWVPAYEKAEKRSTRKSPHEQLSRRALRARLYRYNVPKALWAELLSKYAGRPQVTTVGEPTLKQKWGYSIAKAVGRHVGRRFVFLDEFAYYALPGTTNIAETARSCRKVNAALLVATQTLSTDLQSMPEVVLGMDEISVIRGPASPSGVDVKLGVDQTFEEGQKQGAQANSPLDFILTQDTNDSMPDMSRVLGPIVAQTSRVEAGGLSSTRGEVLTGAELERRRKLGYRVLTAADIPGMTWSKDFEQYFLREDGAVVTRDRIVPWGTLTPSGHIEWTQPDVDLAEAPSS